MHRLSMQQAFQQCYICNRMCMYTHVDYWLKRSDSKLIVMKVGIPWCQRHLPPARSEKLLPVFSHLRSDPSWYLTLCPCQCQCHQNLNVSFLGLLCSEPGLQGLEKGSEQECWPGLEAYLMDQPALSQKALSDAGEKA